MISKESIDKVYEAIRVEEVIQDYVQLKKSGANFKGLSPFTEERTPSFMVSPVKQIWKDFSSGKGGNAIAFLMEIEHYTYPEAIRHLANKYGIEIEETAQTDEQKMAADQMESLYLVSEFAKNYFEESLWDSENGKAIGLSYFKERGFKEHTIKKFQLGYCSNQWDAMTKTGLKKGYELEYLEQSGLSIVKDQNGQKKSFDRFKGRVMFPIHSNSGRVLGFGGRTLESDKKIAKYVNSPESLIYNKSKVLYGIYFAKSAIAKNDNCIIVEGYTDVIQMHQRGIENVVASSGTALTEQQIRIIQRLTSNITVLFDSDAAGVRAAIRGIDLILAQGMNVKVCIVPEGEDPDSFAKNNTKEDILDYLESNQKDFISFKSELLLDEVKNDPIKKSNTVRAVLESIAVIPDSIKKELYIKQTALQFDLNEGTLFSSLAQIEKKSSQNQQKQTRDKSQNLEIVSSQPKKHTDKQWVLEKNLIQILLLYGDRTELFVDEVYVEDNDTGQLILTQKPQEYKVIDKIYVELQQDEMNLAHTEFQELYGQLISYYSAENQFDSASFFQYLNSNQRVDLIEIASGAVLDSDKHEIHNWEKRMIFVKERETEIVQWLQETVLSLRCVWVQKHIENIQKKTKDQSNPKLLEEVINYISLNKLLNERLNRVLYY